MEVFIPCSVRSMCLQCGYPILPQLLQLKLALGGIEGDSAGSDLPQ